MSRYQDWLNQAENDLLWADHSFKGQFYSQTCFIAQQASEKTLKAYCFFKGFDIVRTHSLFQIVKNLGENGVLEKMPGSWIYTTSPHVILTPSPLGLHLKLSPKNRRPEHLKQHKQSIQ